jgi:hypothetical protein
MDASDAPALFGGVSRPSRKAWTWTRGAPPLVAVHAAGREEAQDVQRRAIRARRGDGAGKRRVGGELAGLDRAIDAGEFLVDHAPRPHVEMTNLRITHLAGWESDRALGGVDDRVRMVAPQAVPVRLRRQAHRVVRRGLAAADAVEDQQDDGSDFGRGIGHRMTGT